MKKFTAIFLIIVFAFTLTACGISVKTGTDGKGSGKGKTAATAPTDSDDTGELTDEQLDAALSLLIDSDHKKWPAERLHPDMPEYGEGTLNGWNQWSDNEYDIFMLIKDTSEADLEEYKAALDSAGFQFVNGRDYRKDAFEIRFQFNTDTILQISSYKEETVSWPKDLAGIPPLKKGILTGVIEPSEEVPDAVQLYYINLTQADIDEWKQELKDNGFSVGEYNDARLENATLRSKTYGSLYVQMQENGTDEWMVDFFYSE